jgi:hypothetical protein
MVYGLMLFHVVSIRLTTYDKIGGSPKTVTNAGWQLVALFGDYPGRPIQKVYKSSYIWGSMRWELRDERAMRDARFSILRSG